MYFRDVIGLQDIKKQLIESVQEGFIPHARIFYGPEGVGKLPLAIAYARYLNCSNRTADDACGECSSCSKFDKLAHPDLHFVFPVVKSKLCDDYLSEWREFLSVNHYFTLANWLSFIDSQNAQGLIYAKESDEILRKLSLKVYEAPYKIMIIWLPEKMHESCANKLLKLIEEPPASTVFLLVSEDRDNVLQTIWSRCQPLHIKRIEDDRMTSAIEDRFKLNHAQASAYAFNANGSFTEAIELITSSEDRARQLNLFKEMMRASVSRNVKRIKQFSVEIAAIGRERQKEFLLYSLRLFREYFVSNLNIPDIVYLDNDEQKFGVRFAPFINETNIEQLNDEFTLAYRQIEQNGNAKIIFLDLCLKVTMLLKK